MDYTVLYIILFATLSVALGIGVAYFMKKANLKASDIVQGVDISKTIIQFVKLTAKDLKFGNDEEIDKISNIIIEVLDYIKTLSETIDKKDKISKATMMALKLCKEANIEVNSDRAYIISTLITIAYNILDSLELQKLNK